MDVVNSDEVVSYETTREFFSHLKSEKSLQLVIDIIFELADVKPDENDSFHTNNIYNRIWNLYKQTDDEREKKEQSRVDGNHVRKVVKPIEERMKIMEQKIDKMEKDMKDDMKEIKDLLLKITNK